MFENSSIMDKRKNDVKLVLHMVLNITCDLKNL